MNAIYDKEKYYKKYKSYFNKIIKDFKKADPEKKYKYIETANLRYCRIYKYKFSEIIYIFFKIYYILKHNYFTSFANILINLFEYFRSNMKNEYIKYIKIFYIILKKYYPENIKDIFENIFDYYYDYLDLNYELYLEYLENLFFYNFFYMDINTCIINHIKNDLSDILKDKDIIKPLENILSWSIMREIWICLCIFAKPKKYNKIKQIKKIKTNNKIKKIKKIKTNKKIIKNTLNK